MAMVSLINLFEKDKNFYGLLNLDAPCKARIVEGMRDLILPEFLNKLDQNLPLVDSPRKFMELCPEWAGPEWMGFNDNGCLHNWEYIPDTKCTIIELDMTDWLKGQDKGILRTITTISCWQWTTSKDLNNFPISKKDLAHAPDWGMLGRSSREHNVEGEVRFLKHLGFTREEVMGD